MKQIQHRESPRAGLYTRPGCQTDGVIRAWCKNEAPKSNARGTDMRRAKTIIGVASNTSIGARTLQEHKLVLKHFASNRALERPAGSSGYGQTRGHHETPRSLAAAAQRQR